MNNLMRLRMMESRAGNESTNKNQVYNPQSNSYTPDRRGGAERMGRPYNRTEWEEDEWGDDPWEDEEEKREKRKKKREREEKGRKAIKAGGTFWMDDGEEEAEPLTKEQAEKWVREMHGAGSEGEKWSMDDLKAVAQKHGIPMEGEKFVEFYAVMNALYSDYAEVAKKYNVNNPDFFANMAKAWMNDKDAVDNKTAIYYERIVKK